MTRNCPKCSARLGTYDKFFCSSCGNILPENLIQRGSEGVRLIPFESDSKNLLLHHFKESIKHVFRIINPVQIIISLVLAGLIIAGFFGIRAYYLQKNKALVLNNPQDTSIEDKILVEMGQNTVASDLPVKQHIFGADKIAEYIPAEALVYVEGHDFDAFSDIYKLYDPAYETLLEYMKYHTGDHFAAYLSISDEGEPKWTVLVFSQVTLNEIEEDFPDLNELYPWLVVSKVEEVLVLTTDERQLEEIKGVKAKTIKNISQNPMYSAAQRRVPKEGKLQVLFLNDLAKEYLEKTFLENEFPEDSKKVLESISTKENLYYVFK